MRFQIHYGPDFVERFKPVSRAANRQFRQMVNAMEQQAKIGIQISPDILAMIFRAGATITTKNGYVIHLAEGGVPADYRLQKYGIDPETKQAIFVFGPPGPRVQGPVKWQAPVYEREKQEQP